MTLDYADRLAYFPSRQKPCEWCGAKSFIPKDSGSKLQVARFCDEACHKAYERQLYVDAVERMPAAPFGLFSIVDLMRFYGTPNECQNQTGINVWARLRNHTHLKWLLADRAAVATGIHPSLVWGMKWWLEAGHCVNCGSELRAEWCHVCDAEKKRRRAERRRAVA